MRRENARAGCNSPAAGMLALHRHGKDDGRAPLVMVHGFLCSGQLFSPNIKALQQTRQLITVDLPGFGESSTLPAANCIAEMSGQVAETLAAAGIARYHLLGHSMGGMVALQLALTAPARLHSLIVYASYSSGNLPERFETFAQSKQRLHRDFTAAKRHICATWLNAGTRHAHFDLLLQCSAPVSLATAEKALDAMAAFDISAQVGAITLPTLLLSAEQDKTYAARCQRDLAAQLPQAQCKVMRNCAHCAHLEDEAAFNQILSAWLHTHAAART